jgi:RIO kinase 3
MGVFLLQDFAMDERTRILIYKMVNAEVLEDVTGIVSTGKEAVVLHATGGR